VQWSETATTLQLWSQIVGKTRLALEPLQNHWWNVALYPSARGLTTSLMYAQGRAVEIELDLIEHALRVRTEARDDGFALEAGMSVARFYARYRETLASLGIECAIYAKPVEIAEAIPFDRDETHAAYDRAWASSFARTLHAVDPIFREFRGRFLGKQSPVHFFWGAFDLAQTRFSGRAAPRHPGGIPNCPDWVMHEAYSHEVSSAGFWVGDGRAIKEPVFYAYAYPQPDGYDRARVAPDGARWDATWREYFYPLSAARDLRRDLLAFLQSTYEAAAELAHWDRASLERRS